MNLPKRQVNKQIGLIGAIFGGLLLIAPAIAQTNTTPNNTNTTPGTSNPLSDTERDRLCASYMNDTGATNSNAGSSTAGDRNLGTNRSSGSSASGQTTTSRSSGSSTSGQTSASRNNSGSAASRVGGSSAVGDGNSANVSAADRQRICADYIREQGINRDTPSRTQTGTPSNRSTTPSNTQNDTNR